MDGFKKVVKSILSDQLITKLTSLSYGWHGNYKSWDIARSKCKGYDEKLILDKIVNTALRVKNGEIPYERDGVAFGKNNYSFPVLAGLMWIAGENGNKLNVLDFGGSMGTSYYQNLFFLNSLKEANWCIVEQKHFVEEGIKAFADDKLHFYYTIDECTKNYPVDTVLLSGVIQYLERPYELLEEIISRNFKYILIDRTLFIDDAEDRLTIQKVPKKIYEASYCCWFLSESKFLSRMLNKYEIVYDFEIKENINIRSLYKGYFFRLKTNS